jgi:type II secretory pathway pseudopilin PulG
MAMPVLVRALRAGQKVRILDPMTTRWPRVSARYRIGVARMPCQAGTSLLEVIVAIVLVTSTLAAFAPLLIQCTRLVVEAGEETQALTLAASRLEQLRSLTFEQDAVTLIDRTDEVSDLSSDPPGRGGTGLLPRDPSAAWQDVPGHTDLTRRDGRPARGVRDAMFVRRWAVSALPAPAGVDRRLVQVFARARSAEVREPPRRSGDRRRGDVWLFAIRSRRLR